LLPPPPLLLSSTAVASLSAPLIIRDQTSLCLLNGSLLETSFTLLSGFFLPFFRPFFSSAFSVDELSTGDFF
ncbi:hypothetical protein PMAYCL1PPCAC_20009, partial [Pristionchus mayeri]